MIRVLVVDDSATMRSLITAALLRDSAIEVVGQAADPLEAREKIKALQPDVLTLDVEMPNMNGLDFLERLMRLRPMPVVMVSTLTTRGAAATLEALELGAVDCVAKPSFGGACGFDDLADKVRAAASARVRPSGLTPAPVAAPISGPYESDGRVLAIGASTGGVEALISILSRLPANAPPTVITQHMPATFTRSFAERLDRLSPMRVREAAEGAVLAPGHAYVAPGGEAHLQISGSGPGSWRCRIRPGDPVNGHRPSVDVLFESVAKTCGARALGVILTGMGRDGAQGLKTLRQGGASTLGQDEPSCVVYGMPKAAFEGGAVEKQASLQRLPAEILNLTNIAGERRP
jgi:two-component system chemotaxis response regulator CheB